MANISKYFLILCLLLLSFLPSSFSQNVCNPLDSPTQKPFRACQNLPALGSILYWNYYPSTGTVDIAFQQPVVSDSRWAAWAINPTSAGMAGSQAIIAFRKSDGTMSVYSSPIKSYGTQLEQGNLSFPLYDVSAIYENNRITIFATIPLPKNVTVVNHVWQEGPLSGNTPRMHSISGPNVQSFGTIDFLSGKVEQTKGSTTSALSKLKIAHAVLNTISWGILMPIGAIAARHLKVFSWADPAWFHAHRTCQMLAYVGGLSGWLTGLWLGYKSSGVEYKGHRCIGISLFVLATLQVAAALFLRPKKADQKRLYWNLFHYAVGYGTIGLSILNILKGFDIMQPAKQWKYAYIGTIAALGCLAVLFEPFRCYYVRRAKPQVTVEQESDVDAV